MRSATPIVEINRKREVRPDLVPASIDRATSEDGDIQ